MSLEALNAEKSLIFSRIQLIDADPQVLETHFMGETGSEQIVFVAHTPLAERKVFLERLENSGGVLT